jgi:hypothetical protein
MNEGEQGEIVVYEGTEEAGPELLMQEYSLRMAHSEGLLRQSWLVGAVLVAAAIGTFGFIALQSAPTLKSLLLTIVVGYLSWSLISMWVQMMERWQAMAQVSKYRAREIESRLGLWGGRYLHHLVQPAASPSALSGGEQARFKQVQEAFDGKFPKERASNVARRLPSLFATIWIVWIVYQMLWFILTKVFLVICMEGPSLGRLFEAIVLGCQ